MILRTLALSVPALLLASITSAEIAAEPSVGFVSTRGGAGFAYEIRGTDFDAAELDENIVLFTLGQDVPSHFFFVEWLDESSGWHSIAGSVSDYDIADEAFDRGLSPEAFDGIRVDPGGGDQVLGVSGSAQLWILPGAPYEPTMAPSDLTGPPLGLILEPDIFDIDADAFVQIDPDSGFFHFQESARSPEISQVGSRTILKGSELFIVASDWTIGPPATSVPTARASMRPPASQAMAGGASGATFGFIDTRGGAGFAFWIRAPDIAEGDENIVLWTDFTTSVTYNFFLEWLDPARVWHSLSGSLTPGDIADEAQDRGLAGGDYDGFLVEPGRGSHILALDGTGQICTLPGAPCSPMTVGPFIFGTPLAVMLEPGLFTIDLAGVVTIDPAQGSFVFGEVDHDPMIWTLESQTQVKGPGDAAFRVFAVPEPSAATLLAAVLAALGLLKFSTLGQ